MLGLFLAQSAWGQQTIRHQAPVALERSETHRLEFHATGLDRSDINQATLFYRYDGDVSYQQLQADIEPGLITASLQVNAPAASSIEYYLEIDLQGGQTSRYPADGNPVQVEIIDAQQKTPPSISEIDYTILSPKAGTGLRKEDVVIAMALFYDENAIPDGTFQLLLDEEDVTSQADTSAFYISYVPETLSNGQHTIHLQYKTSRQTYSVAKWDFSVVSPGQATFQGFERQPDLMPSGQIELTARNQVIAGDVNNAYTGHTQISGEYGDLRYSLNGYLTSQESDRLQPQNRYALNLRMGNWWHFDAGHVYPSLSKFTISGRRIHGLNTSFHFFNEGLNFQFLYGELDRDINNLYDQLVIQEETTASGAVVDTSYTLTYQNQGRGTFRREIIGGRIGFGNPETFQWGVHALKIQDDTTSVRNIRSYSDLIGKNTDLGGALSPADRQKLQQNPNLLNVEGGALRARDNFVAGTDLQFGFHQNRIRLESEAVISALNDNIYGGPLTVERADELGFDITQTDADLLQQLSWLIIVNENMNTLPLRIKENEQGENEAEVFFPTSILGGNSELSVRYPRNNLRVQYRWIGPNFNSLANSTIRKDVAGFTVTDRLNLLSNRIYLTLGVEHLQDNVVGNREATTHTNTYRTNVSWYPINQQLPRISVGVRYRTRDNGVKRQNFELRSLDYLHAALRNQRITADGDTVLTTTPRQNHTLNLTSSVSQRFELFDINHNASLNISLMNTTDEVFDYGDITSNSVSLNLTSNFADSPLQTQFGGNFNQTESGSGQNEISIFGLYGGASYVTLQGKLRLNGRIAFTQNNLKNRGLLVRDQPGSPQTDDNPLNDYYVIDDAVNSRSFNTFIVQSGARYSFNDYHALSAEVNFTNVSNATSANDRILQLRYIFNF